MVHIKKKKQKEMHLLFIKCDRGMVKGFLATFLLIDQ